MKKIIPCGNTIVCRKITPANDMIEQDNNGFVVKENIIPVYEIVDFHFLNDDCKKEFQFNIGDKIVSASTGTKIILDETPFWIFKPEHITSKLKEEK